MHLEGMQSKRNMFVLNDEYSGQPKYFTEQRNQENDQILS